MISNKNVRNKMLNLGQSDQEVVAANIVHKTAGNYSLQPREATFLYENRCDALTRDQTKPQTICKKQLYRNPLNMAIK